MSELAWTREKPTVEGKYLWLREPHLLGVVMRAKAGLHGMLHWVRQGWTAKWPDGWYYGPLPVIETKGERSE